jgi:UDP-N-acetylglucosamine 2-epimerase (non-hydrolysing)
MQITLVAGTRPNFVKISPIIKALQLAKQNGDAIDFRLIHTGQHYDRAMSESFFEDLEIPEPDSNLGVGSGSQAEQTAAIMIGFERELNNFPTDLVLVVGDVTSTMACAIVAKKMNVKLAHVEGGIRSLDNSMPEEINRKVTDSITDLFFTTSSFANDNLKKEGIEKSRIHFVGNVMIDTLLSQVEKLRRPQIFDLHNLDHRKYLVLTLHRPANVDDPENLRNILSTIQENSKNCPIIFPVHPRTKKVMIENNIVINNLVIIDPLGYSEFNYLVKHAFGVITDSGGITEETTVLGIPCLTLRDNTERPETCIVGTNKLIGTDPKKLTPALDDLFSGNWQKGGIPALWDGKSAERIVAVILRTLRKD